MTLVPRPSSSLVAFWALAGIGVLYLGDSFVRGTWTVFALAVAPVALIVWAAWMFLYRPRVSFDTNQVVVVNPGRMTTVPWQRVQTVRQRFQIVLELRDGTSLTCWGSPFPEKPGRSRPEPAAARIAGGLIAGPLESARNQAEGRVSDAVVERRWDIVPLAIGAGLLLACVAELATAH